jgi:carbon storage regulator
VHRNRQQQKWPTLVIRKIKEDRRMLVLCRKLGESIAIAGEIKLQVLGVSGNRVRLGISAPDDCRIFRAECRVEEPAQNARRVAATSLAGSGI